MSNQVKSISLGTAEPGVDLIYTELTVIATTSTTNLAGSVYTVFPRAYSVTPRVLGLQVLGVTPGVISARPSPTGITIYWSPASTAATGGAAVVVAATLRGELA